jgi:hypothetical protein
VSYISLESKIFCCDKINKTNKTNLTYLFCLSLFLDAPLINLPPVAFSPTLITLLIHLKMLLAIFLPATRMNTQRTPIDITYSIPLPQVFLFIADNSLSHQCRTINTMIHTSYSALPLGMHSMPIMYIA